MGNPVEAARYLCKLLPLLVLGMLSITPNLSNAQVIGPGWAPGFGEVLFSTTPSEPTTSDEIALEITRVFGDPGQQLLTQSMSIDGFTITADLLMQDQHYNPDWGFPQVIVEEGAVFDLGALAAGTYEVNASISFLPWPYTEADLLDPSLGEGLWFIQSLSRVTGTHEFEVTGIIDTALKGDYNQDGAVDAADYTVWRDAMSSGNHADGNGDGLTNDTDRLFWANQYGDTNTPSAAVPEPVAGLLVLFTVSGLAHRRNECCHRRYDGS